eukprot:TRINITY_DN6221_c0_g5_i1.p1 TRINITY_DN6221_c0_g5~~TRINITY_DN6221_c0_g5_i1.p1  ORF type:complete len:397 (+),score=52.28 TRINITY_DN6221_c0_g5_i1:64-1254(+)
MNAYDDHGWFEVKPSTSALTEFPDYLDYVRERYNFANDDPTWRGYLNPDSKLREVLADVVRNVPQAYSYTPSIGTKDAREAFIKLVGAPEGTKWDLTFLMIGRELGISITARSICNPGDKILIPTPCDPFIRLICSRYKFIPVDYRIDVNAMRVDTDHLSAQIAANPDAKFIFLMNPLVPTGTVFGRQALEEILSVSSKTGIVVVCDETWRDWTPAAAKPPSLLEVAPEAPKAIIADLGIKLAAPGLRMGGVVFHDPVGVFEEIAPGVQTLSQILIHPSSLVQAAMPRLSKELDQEYISKSLIPKIQENSHIFQEGLKDKAAFIPSAGTHFLCFRPLGFSGTATEFCEVLKGKHHAKLVPARFFIGQNAPDDFVRIELSAETDVYRDLAATIKTIM